MSIHSLEAERQAILDRMQRTREGYRSMLNGREHAVSHQQHSSYPAVSGGHGAMVPAHHQQPHAHTHASSQLNFAHLAQFLPRSGSMRVLTDHPVLCALAVAAVVAIGPKRIVRSAQSAMHSAQNVMNSGTKVANLTVRNQANIALLMQLVTMVTDVLQRRNSTRHP